MKGMAGVQRIFPLCLFIFFTIMSREILMDINDTEGDGNSQIYTVPVTFGKRTALALSAVTWTVALLHSLFYFWNGAVVQYIASMWGPSVARAIPCLALIFVMCPVYFTMWRGLSSDFDKKLIADLIGETMVVIGKGLILLTIFG